MAGMSGMTDKMKSKDNRLTANVLNLVAVQIYEFHDSLDGVTYLWNATEGRRLAEARSAEVVAVYPADLGMTQEKILSMYPDLDKVKALSLPPMALLSPLLFVTHRTGSHVLIDGWHRLYLAVTVGIDCLPAYVLTRVEADSVRIGSEGGKAGTGGKKGGARGVNGSNGQHR